MFAATSGYRYNYVRLPTALSHLLSDMNFMRALETSANEMTTEESRTVALQLLAMCANLRDRLGVSAPEVRDCQSQ